MSEIDATVVVPVYNPGSAIEACIDSLLAQTLPASRLQLIFSDDGSTDGTGERLDRLAAEHAQVQVIHSPNSGWPGRPRNLGIEAATGEYIQFVDNDDTLAPEALERLVAYGRENSSDIVIGKVTSDFRPVPHRVFKENVPSCTIWDSRIMSGLTPHKLFRRQFLMDTGIRYPEGKVRLEDQLFVTKTFFAAKVVSILADYPCYFYQRHPEGTNAGGQDVEPAVYYRYVREVLDVAVENTKPTDELRTRIWLRFWRAGIDSCGKAAVGGRLPGYLEKLYDVVMKMNADYFPPDLDLGLTAFRQAQAALMRKGDLVRLAEITERATVIEASVELSNVAWTGTSWRARLTAQLVDADGSPLTMVPSGGGWRLDPRIAPGDIDIPAQTLEEIVEQTNVDVTLRHRDDGIRWFVPGEWTPSVEPLTSDPEGPAAFVYTGEIEIDPETVAVGGPLTTGRWDLFVSMHAFGVGGTVGGALRRETVDEPLPVLLRPRPRLAYLRLPDQGRVGVVVRPPKALTHALATRVTSVSVEGNTLVASIALQLAGGPETTKCELLIGDTRLPARVRAVPAGAELRAGLKVAGRLLRGPHEAMLVVREGDEPKMIASLEVGRLGGVTIAADT